MAQQTPQEEFISFDELLKRTNSQGKTEEKAPVGDTVVEEPTSTATTEEFISFDELLKKTKNEKTAVADSKLTDPVEISFAQKRQQLKTEVDKIQSEADQKFREDRKSSSWFDRRKIGATNAILSVGEDITALLSLAATGFGLDDQVRSLEETREEIVGAKQRNSAKIPTSFKGEGVKERIDAHIDDSGVLNFNGKGDKVQVEVSKDGTFEELRDKDDLKIELDKQQIEKFNSNKAENVKKIIGGPIFSGDIDALQIITNAEQTFYDIGSMVIGGSGVAKVGAKLGRKISNRGYLASSAFIQSYSDNYEEALQKTNGDVDKALNNAAKKSLATGLLSAAFASLELDLINKVGDIGKSALEQAKRTAVTEFAEGTITKSGLMPSVIQKLKTAGINVGQEQVEEVADLFAGNFIDVSTGVDTKGVTRDELEETIATTFFASAPFSAVNVMSEPTNNQSLTNSAYAASQDPDKFDEVMDETVDNFRESGASSAEIAKFEKEAAQKKKIIRSLSNNLKGLPDKTDKQKLEIVRDLVQRDKLAEGLENITNPVIKADKEEKLKTLDENLSEKLKSSNVTETAENASGTTEGSTEVSEELSTGAGVPVPPTPPTTVEPVAEETTTETVDDVPVENSVEEVPRNPLEENTLVDDLNTSLQGKEVLINSDKTDKNGDPIKKPIQVLEEVKTITRLDDRGELNDTNLFNSPLFENLSETQLETLKEYKNSLDPDPDRARVKFVAELDEKLQTREKPNPLPPVEEKVSKKSTIVEPKSIDLPENPTSANLPIFKDKSKLTSDDNVFDSIMDLDPANIELTVDDAEVDGLIKGNTIGKNAVSDFVQLQKRVQSKVAKDEPLSQREFAFANKFNIDFKSTTPKVESPITKQGKNRIKKAKFTKDETVVTSGTVQNLSTPNAKGQPANLVKAIAAAFNPDAGNTVKKTTTKRVKKKNLNFEADKIKFEQAKVDFDKKSTELRSSVDDRLEKANVEFKKARGKISRDNVPEGSIISDNAGKKFKVRDKKSANKNWRIQAVDDNGKPIIPKGLRFPKDVFIKPNDLGNFTFENKIIATDDSGTRTPPTRAQIEKQVEKEISDLQKELPKEPQLEIDGEESVDVVTETPATENAEATAELYNRVVTNIGRRLGKPAPEVWKDILAGVVKTTTDRVEQEAGKVRNQDGGNRGAVIGEDDGPKILAALESPDKSTALHELAHLFENWIDLISPNSRNIVLKDYNDFNNLEGDARLQNWDRDVSEFFAKSWESYLRDLGTKSPAAKASSKMRGIFEKFSQWLRDIYTDGLRFKGKDLTVSKPMQRIFDTLLDPNIQKLESVTVEKKPKIVIRDDSRTFTAKDRTAAVQKSGKELLEQGKEFKEVSFKANQAETQTIGRELGLEIAGHQRSSVNQMISRTVDEGLHHLHNALDAARIFNREIQLHDAGVTNITPNLSVERVIGIAAAARRLQDELNRRRRQIDNFKASNKINASATLKDAKLIRADNKWGSFNEAGDFVEAPNQKELDQQYKAQEVTRLEGLYDSYAKQEKELLDALQRSASLAGQALGFLAKSIDGIVSKASQLSKRFRRDTGIEPNATINALGKSLEQNEKKLKALRKELAGDRQQTRKSNAKRQIKNNAKRTVNKKKEDLIAKLRKSYGASPISYQSVDDVPYDASLQDLQDLLNIITNENPGISLEDLMIRTRDVIGKSADDSQINEDIINALIMADPKAKTKAQSQIKKDLNKAKKRAKLIKKLTNRLRDVINPTTRKPRGRQLKDLDKIISELEQGTLLENGMPHDDGALSLSILQNIRNQYGNLGFDQTLAGTMELNSLIKDLKNVRKTLQDKQELNLGNTILRELDALINNELTLTPKSETDKVKQLKRLLIDLKNGNIDAADNVLDQLNTLKKEFGEGTIDTEVLLELSDKIRKFKSVKSDFNKVNNLVKKIKGEIDTKFPAKRTSGNTEIHNRIESIKTLIDNAINGTGPLSDDVINQVIRQFNEIQKTLPDVDDFASDELRQFITNLKMRDSNLINDLDVVQDWLKNDVRQTSNNTAGRENLRKILQEIRVTAGGKLPESKLNDLEAQINELMSDSKSVKSFEAATIQSIKDGIDQYEDAVRIGKVRNDIEKLKAIEKDIIAGKPDAIAAIQPSTNKVFLNKELLALNRTKRAILQKYRNEVDKNLSPGKKTQAFYDKLINTYRNLILTFDLSALGIQAGQLLAAEVGGGLLDLSKGDLRRLTNAGKIVGAAFRFGETRYNDLLKEITNSNAFEISQNLDIPLELNGITEGIVTEEFDKSFLDDFEFIKNKKDGAERSFNATIAMARFKAFENYYINNPTATRAQLSEMADFINTRSGAAQFSGTSSKNGRSILNSIFIAPRLYYSTFKSMATILINFGQLAFDNEVGIGLKKGASKTLNFANKRVNSFSTPIDTSQFKKLSKADRSLLETKNKENLYTVAGFLVLHGTLALLTTAGRDEEDVDTLTNNPVAGNFLAIRNNDFSLNSSYLIPYMRLISKLGHELGILEENVDNTLAENRHYSRQDGKDMWFNFLKYKLSPLMGIMLTGLKNQNAIRQPLNIKTDAQGLERYTQEYAIRGSAYNFATQSFPLPISIRGAVDLAYTAFFKEDTLSAGNKLADHPVAKSFAGTILNIVGVSGHSMDNQARSVFANDVFRKIDKNPPSPGSLLPKDFPAIFKKTDANGDANALGHFLANETQNEVGAYLQRARGRGLSIDDIKPGKIKALRGLLNDVGRQTAKYHMTRLNKKYELSTVPVKYKSTHKINWAAFDARLDNLLKK